MLQFVLCATCSFAAPSAAGSKPPVEVTAGSPVEPATRGPAGTSVRAPADAQAKSVGLSAVPAAPILAEPVRKRGVSLEEALASRRSVKSYDAGRDVPLSMVSQCLWALDGVNRKNPDRRTHPSPLARYTVDVYVCLAKGVYRYRPDGHRLVPVIPPGDWKGDPRKLIPRQGYTRNAPVLFILVGYANRLPERFKTLVFPESLRWNWVYCEAGTMMENLYVQAAALGLGTSVNALCDADRARKLLGLGDDAKVLFLMPLGYEAR